VELCKVQLHNKHWLVVALLIPCVKLSYQIMHVCIRSEFNSFHSHQRPFVHSFVQTYSFSILVLFFFRLNFLFSCSFFFFLKKKFFLLCAFEFLSQFSHCTLLIFTLVWMLPFCYCRVVVCVYFFFHSSYYNSVVAVFFVHHAHHIIAESDFFASIFFSSLQLVFCVVVAFIFSPVLLNGKMPSRKHLVWNT